MNKKKVMGIILGVGIAVSASAVYVTNAQAKQEKIKAEKVLEEKKVEEERLEKERLEQEKVEAEKRVEEEKKRLEEEKKIEEEKKKIEEEKAKKKLEESKKAEAIKKENERKKAEEKKQNESKENNAVTQNFIIQKLDENEKRVVAVNFKTKGVSIEDNLRKIVMELNSKVFQGVQVSFKGIENVGGKKIAVIDLKDGSKKWMETYLQGSIQGASTDITLVEGFLQRGMAGPWINGVRFTVNGGKIPGSTHAERIANTNYR